MHFQNSTVTPEDIEGFIESAYYINAGEAAPAYVSSSDYSRLSLLTICVLVLRYGFTVTGEGACADPARYNREIGEKIAREKAVEKIWPLLGFMLRDQLHQIETAPEKSWPHMTTRVGQKVVHALPMNRRDYNTLRGWALPVDENGDDEGFLVEYADVGSPNVEGYAGYVSWSPADVFERAYGPFKGTEL